MPQNIVSYEEVLINFKKLLRTNTLKYTKQRELILEIIYDNEGHFTPEDIYNLEDASIVSSISFGAQGKKYEFGLKDHHDHLVCLECGAIEEFIDDIIEKRQEDIAKEFNFKMTNHIMKITGICSTCQGKE